jgi:hypothetical protein
MVMPVAGRVAAAVAGGLLVLAAVSTVTVTLIVSRPGAPGGIRASGQVKGAVQQESRHLLSAQYLPNQSTLTPDPADADTDDLRPPGRNPGRRWPPAVRPGSAAVPAAGEPPLDNRNPSPFKATGPRRRWRSRPVSALSNPEDEIADTARQNVRFRHGSFDRLSDLDWRPLQCHGSYGC